MMHVDTHTHLYVEEFDTDREAMLERAVKEGVTKMLLPAIDSESHGRLLALSAAHPENCLPMMGLHPCYVKENFREELRIAREYLEKGGFVGVGEIGLDFYWDRSFDEQQYLAFREQLDWAMHFDLPVSIHSRNATDECLAVVKEKQNGKLKGVFHCFSGDLKQAKEAIDLGFKLGIGGVLTFKNGGLDKVLPSIQPEHLVLETDAPYLAPVPFRGKRNEPAYLKYVVEKLALLYAMPETEVAVICTNNAKNLFGI
jgi:TatD DNase family protein